MQSDAAPIAPKKQPRSQGPRHAFDRRSRSAKRFASLVEEFTAELGGPTLVSEARLAVVRQLASVILQAEEYQASIIRGEIVDAEQLVRVANLQTRLMRQLGVGKSIPAGGEKPNLADYLKGRAA